MAHSRTDNLANKKTRKTGLFATSIRYLASLLIWLLRAIWSVVTVDLPTSIKAVVCYFADSSVYDDWCDFSRDTAQTGSAGRRGPVGLAVYTVGEDRRDREGWSGGSGGAGWADWAGGGRAAGYLTVLKNG